MTLLSTRRVYTGRIVSLDIDTVRFPNGNVGELEMIRHPGASAVLPFLDPVEDPDPRVLLIRQYRHATGDYLWEIPAGRRDGEESPETTARARAAGGDRVPGRVTSSGSPRSGPPRASPTR